VAVGMVVFNLGGSICILEDRTTARMTTDTTLLIAAFAKGHHVNSGTFVDIRACEPVATVAIIASTSVAAISIGARSVSVA